MKFFAVLVMSLSATALALPRRVIRDSGFTLQNGEQAIAQNEQFASLSTSSSCTDGSIACVNQQFAQCVQGKYVLQSCGTNLICAALPLVNSAGTSVTCTTQDDVNQRIAATGATSASNSTSSVTASSGSAVASSSAVVVASDSAVPVASSSTVPVASGSAATVASATAAAVPSSTATASSSNDTASQSSLTLLDSLINTGFEDDGTNEFSSEPGEIASITSSDNFINFCATVNLPLTNGTQVKNGSCNAAPMGVIASTTAMPSSKFVSPANLGTVPANTNFTVAMAIRNLETGWFVNPDTNYFAAPQQVNTSTGLIMGHSHVVIEEIEALNQTTPTDPTKFAFFKGLNDVAVNGTLSTVVTGGLPKGFYRMASINAAANHQPALVAVAQHGTLDDMIYFTVE